MEENKFPNEQHFMKCNICQQLFDMRDLQQVFEHEHKDLEKPKHPYYGEKKQSTKELPKWVEKFSFMGGTFNKQKLSDEMDLKHSIEQAFRKGYSLGHIGGSTGEGYFEDKCWETYKTNNL